MEKENQRIRITKRLFKENLILLLKEKTIYNITVTELCNKAELNRTTFYKYYENIFDVLADIEYEFLKKTDIIEVEELSEKEIKNTLYNQLCNIQKDKDIYYLLLINNVDDTFYETLLKSTIDLFKRSIEKFNINLGDNTDYIFSYIIVGTIDIIKKWLAEENPKSPQDITNLICDLTMKILNIKQ